MPQSPQEIKELQAEQLEQLKQQQQDHRDCFSTDSGKRVLKLLEAYCFQRRSTYTPGCTDKDLAYREGLRSAYLHLVNMQNIADQVIEVQRKGQQSQTPPQAG